MKIMIPLFSFYLLLLMAIPTILVMKSEFGCADACAAAKNQEMPKGCQKQKCVLNMNFSTGQFILNEAEAIIFNPLIGSEVRQAFNYRKNLIPDYHHNIWNPPKNGNFIS